MKYVNDTAVMAWMSIAGILLGLSVPFLAATEAADSEPVAPAEQVGEPKRPAPVDSWVDADTPVSALRPSIGRSRAPAEETIRDGSRLFSYTRSDAITGLHEQFRTGLAWLDTPYARRGIPDYLRSLLKGDFKNWLIIESSSGAWIEPKFPFGNDGYHNMQSIRISFEPRDRRSLKLADQSNEQDISAKKIFFDHVDAKSESDSMLGLFRALNEKVSITEWKLSRPEMIGRTKRASLDCDPDHLLDVFGGVHAKPKGLTASTMTLSRFEQRAIQSFQSHPFETVVISETEDEILIVGALRAERRCLNCHSVEKGELLGGLSYRFTRAVQPERVANLEFERTH